MLELDHLFVTVPPNASSINTVLAHGLVEGTPNVHPGQGTANRRIFFHNAMLEFLWLTNRAEALSAPIRRTHLAERCDPTRATVCPFGICLRWVTQPSASLPFATFDYAPPYLPAGMVIPMATNADRLDEPLIFCIAFGGRPDQFSTERRQPLDHPAGLIEISAIKLTLPLAQPPSDALHYLSKAGLVIVETGERYQMVIEFDRCQQGCHANFAPDLPLRLHW